MCSLSGLCFLLPHPIFGICCVKVCDKSSPAPPEMNAEGPWQVKEPKNQPAWLLPGSSQEPSAHQRCAHTHKHRGTRAGEGTSSDLSPPREASAPGLRVTPSTMGQLESTLQTGEGITAYRGGMHCGMQGRSILAL